MEPKGTERQATGEEQSLRRGAGAPGPDAGQEPGRGGWFLRRWLPALLLAGAAGAALGWLRATLFFVPGIQGMVAGGASGWLAGRLGRGDASPPWRFGQRIWLALGMALAYGTAHLCTLSALRAGPIDAPLAWLLEVADGLAAEPFLGLARHTTHAGYLDGGWWVGLNLLDMALFAFLGLVATGVGLFPDRPGAVEGEDVAGEDGDEADAEPATEPDLPAGPAGAPSALYGFLGLCALLAAGGLGYQRCYLRRDPVDFSLQGLERLRGLAGSWRLEDGGGLFGPRGAPCALAAEAGFGGLTLRPEDGRPGEQNPADLEALLRGERGKTWRLNLDRSRGSDFSGLLFFHGPGNEGRMPVPVRARFSEDGNTITLAWSRFSAAGREEVTLRGARPERH